MNIYIAERRIKSLSGPDYRVNVELGATRDLDKAKRICCEDAAHLNANAVSIQKASDLLQIRITHGIRLVRVDEYQGQFRRGIVTAIYEMPEGETARSIKEEPKLQEELRKNIEDFCECGGCE